MEVHVNATIKFNQISDQLKQIVKDSMPKRGQIFTFQSVRPGARGTTVISQDRILDPYTGEFVDIAYVTGNKTGVGPVTGRIQFRRSEGGTIQIRGGDNRDAALFQYLFLTNQLEGNSDKPWFVSTEGRAQIFRLLKPSATAEEKLKFSRQVRMAQEAIDRMPNDLLWDLASGLDMQDINEFSDPNEIRLKLEDIAKVNPDKIFNLDKDKTLPIKVLVKDAEKLGIIKSDDQLKQYVWPDSGDVICVIPPDKNLREGMVTYLLSLKGEPVLDLISNLVRAKKESPKPGVAVKHKTSSPEATEPEKKKGGRPAGSKNK